HNLKSVYEGGGYQHEGIKFYNSDYKKHHICYARDLIVPNTEQGEKHKLIGFPARIPSYFKDVSILTHHLFLIRPLNTSYLTNEYIYYLLYSHLLRKQILGYTNGTTVNMLSPDGLKKPIFPKPPQELISNFSQVIKPVWDKFENNIQQIQTLTKTRDALLPKLMSGQIRVKEGESIIEEE
ncbi:MAG: restriction endonuclease subunit S, partial [Planktothrix sp.]